MIRTLYTARYLLPITAPPVEDGAVLVGEGQIVAVGLRKDLLSTQADLDVVDFGESILLPPMANAHTHLELTDYPQWAAEAGEHGQHGDFVDWILKLVRIRQNVDEQSLRNSMVKGLQESLKSGTGTIGDILTSLAVSDLYGQSPLSGTVFAEVLGQGADVVSDRLALIQKMLAAPPGSSLAWGISPHAPYTLSAAAMNRVFAFAAEHNLQQAIHLAESPEESLFAKENDGPIADRLYPAAQWNPAADPVDGSSPVNALCARGRLGPGALAVHGVQVDEGDIDMLKRAGCSVVLCPRSNATLGVGKAPLDNYVKADIPLALGTDSCASAPNLSLWEELAFARQWFDASISPSRWLEIVTLGGARALGMAGQVGALEKGYEASFQVVSGCAHSSLETIEADLCDAGPDIDVQHLCLAGQNVLP